MKIHPDVWWLVSLLVIATAVYERIENGSAGWLSLAVIPAAIYVCGSIFFSGAKRR
jgi:ABC-type Co2+ transport system permease subunit